MQSKKPCGVCLLCPREPPMSACTRHNAMPGPCEIPRIETLATSDAMRRAKEGCWHVTLLTLGCLFSLIVVSGFIRWAYFLGSGEQDGKRYSFLYCCCCYKEAGLRVTANSSPFLFFLFTRSVWTNAQGKKTNRKALQSCTLF